MDIRLVSKLDEAIEIRQVPIDDRYSIYFEVSFTPIFREHYHKEQWNSLVNGARRALISRLKEYLK